MSKHKGMSNKMRRNYHEMAAQIRELEARLAQADADKAQAVAEAQRAVRSEVETELAQLRDTLGSRDALVATGHEERQTLGNLVRNLRAEVEQMKVAHKDEVVKLDIAVMSAKAKATYYKTKFEAVQPTLAKLDSSWEALFRILDGFRARMRKREQVAADAVLNRRAVARALLMPVPPA